MIECQKRKLQKKERALGVAQLYKCQAPKWIGNYMTTGGRTGKRQTTKTTVNKNYGLVKRY